MAEKATNESCQLVSAENMKVTAILYQIQWRKYFGENESKYMAAAMTL
jgi:hypothetical protein